MEDDPIYLQAKKNLAAAEDTADGVPSLNTTKRLTASKFKSNSQLKLEPGSDITLPAIKNLPSKKAVSISSAHFPSFL